MSLDALRSGFVTICISTALNYLASGPSLVVEGQYIPVEGSLTQPDTIIPVPSAGQVDAMFGEGSVLSESLKKAFLAGPGISVFAIPRADPPASVAAVYNLTITGPATAPGAFTLYMLDAIYNIDFPVYIGDSVAVIAAEIVAQIPEDFPYTAVATSSGVTFTAKNKGAIGNYLNPVYNWAGYQTAAPAGVTVACAQTTVGTGIPEVLDYADVLGECCYDAYALLSGNFTYQLGLEKWLDAAWDCSSPQCFGHGYTWNEGTLGMVLACADNAATFCRLPYPLNDVSAPYFIVADYAARSAAIAISNPGESIQGEEYGVLTSVLRPATCSQPWSLTDRQSLAAAGFANWGPASMGTSNLTSPMIYADITNWLYDAEGRPNTTYRSANMRRWSKMFAAATANFLEETFDGLAFFEAGTTIAEGVQATTTTLAYARIVAWAQSQAGVLISQIVNIADQIKLTSSVATSPPCEGIPGDYALQLIVGPPVRAANFNVSILPQLNVSCPTGLPANQ